MRAVCWRHAHRDLCLQETREGTDAKHSGEKAKWDNALTFLYTDWGCWGGHLSAGRFQNKAYYTFSELCRTDHRNNHHPGRQQRTRETSASVCLGTEVGGGFSSKLVFLSLGLEGLCQEPVPEDISMVKSLDPVCLTSGNWQAQGLPLVATQLSPKLKHTSVFLHLGWGGATGRSQL